MQASGRIADAAFAGRRDRVAVCGRYGPTEILTPDGGRRELPGAADQQTIGFSDGLLVVGGADGLTGFTATDGDWVRSWSRAVDSGVAAVAVAVDATTVAAAGDAGTVHLFDRRGVPLRSFAAHADRIWSLCFAPGGDLLLTTSRDNRARGWDLDGDLVLDLGDHRHTVSCAAFAPDGAVLATAATDGRVRLWDRTGRELAVLRAHRGQVWGLAFGADGRELFTGSYDRTVRRWPVAVDDLLRSARQLLRR